ncbi:MAG: hypothetical protein IKW91_01645 [Bacteroidaceae bacterium]|nr:hypothetical protein [Bacteroidaceae bacterium]
MNMTISDVTLKYLCQKYRHDIGTGTNKFLPGIKVRYVAEAKKFAYAYFGNFFFCGDDFYVWEKNEKYAEDHNQYVVEAVFGEECKGRGYARRVLFAGVMTPFKDSNDESIYTGDIIQIEERQDMMNYLAVGAWSHEDGKGEYCFILDNHNWSLEDCLWQHYQMTRVGTVFFQLDASDCISVNHRVMNFNGWRDTEEERQQKVLMARYTPNFDQEFWKYGGLEIMGVEYDWR